MRWLVTGATGMLGMDLVRLLRARGEAVTAASRAMLDVTSPAAVADAVAGHDAVVNSAAWTAVDDAEDHEAEATLVNGEAPRFLARAARVHGARLVHVSTDYVFDGSASAPYAEDAATRPASAYGRSKAAGEKALHEELPGAHLLVRTAWLYGAHGACFPRTITRLARERGTVEVVDDQVGQPTWTRDVAELIARLVLSGAPDGTYHATSSGQASWFDFAREVVAAAGLDPALVHPATSQQSPRAAPRPPYSVLGHDALTRNGIEPIGDWRHRWRAAAPTVVSL
jgi:dTDP-4-dehydrorhamnose reductase